MATEQIILDIRAQVTDAQKRIKDLEKNVKGVNKEVTKSDKLFQKAAGTFVALFSVAAITNFTKKIIEVRAEFEKYNAVLKNTLGSAEAANIEFAKIQKFASETPFSVRELTNAFVKLVNQGFKPSTEALRRLGDLAASTGKSFDQLTEAIIDATVGEFERLKEFGIRAQKSGDTVRFTFKEVETQVKFTRAAIEGYILSLGDLEGVQGAMASISETLGGRISNLGDSWDSLLDTLGGRTSGIFFGVISGLNNLIQAMDNASMSVHELREEVALMQLGAEKELSLNEFLDFVEVAKEEGETYAEVAAKFLEIDKQRLELFPELTEEAGKLLEKLGIEDPQPMLTAEEDLQRRLLQTRIDAIEKYAREQDLADQARLNKRIQAEFEAAQKIVKNWNSAFEKQFTDAQSFIDNIIKEQEDLRDNEIENYEEVTQVQSDNLERRQKEEEDAVLVQAELEQLAGQQRLELAESVLFQLSTMAKEGSALQKTLAIAQATINTYQAANAALSALSGIPIIGPALGIAAAAIVIALGLANVATIAGVTFAEGGYTGKSKYDPRLQDRHGRIAGLVHEDEFVFDKKQTAELRPFFEDIHSGRIDARGLAALTKRGVIVPLIKNDFNSKILENEVRKIYSKMSEEKPQRYTETTPEGLRKVLGNTTINISKN